MALTTFKTRSADERFSSYYENGIKDSIKFTFKFNDSLKNVYNPKNKKDSLAKLTEKK
jgi:hypothetical protein